jgi:agmatinase
MHNLFDLEDEQSNLLSKIQCVPVPWDATCSYRKGARNGPKAILEASDQVDLFELGMLKPHLEGMRMAPERLYLKALNWLAQFNVSKAFQIMNNYVYRSTKSILERKQTPVIVGGDHSVPFGAYRALGEKKQFSIIQIDAHMDLREAYQGFEYSHASIMKNAILKIPNINKLLQIGVRDFCEEEYAFSSMSPKVRTLFYEDIRNGISVDDESLYKDLGENLWLSIDIDGLDPKLCPNTGTPVPGGLEFYDVIEVAKRVIKMGKKIVGFDLVEVSPKKGSIDANVGARLLYKLSCLALVSQGLVEWNEDC